MSSGSDEIHLTPESIEALAVRLAGLLTSPNIPSPAPSPVAKMLTASEVALRWGVSRRWVYDHADALGARRLGTGSRPRLRFDPEEIAERLGAPQHISAGRDSRRLMASAGIRQSNSLSPPHRASVAESQFEAAGGRPNAPGPAPKR